MTLARKSRTPKRPRKRATPTRLTASYLSPSADAPDRELGTAAAAAASADMLCLAAASIGLLPLTGTPLRGRPAAVRGAVSACADGDAAEQARRALQSGDAMQIEEAMGAIIEQERRKGRSEEDIPNSPLLQRLADAQRAANPDVFAAGAAAGASGSVAGGAAAEVRRAAGSEPDVAAPPQAWLGFGLGLGLGSGSGSGLGVTAVGRRGV